MDYYNPYSMKQITNIDNLKEVQGLRINWKIGLRKFISLPAILWIMLWFSINTGPWVFEELKPESIIEWLDWLRALFPYLVLILSGISLVFRRSKANLPGNVRNWLFYGLIGLLACALSPDPLNAVYWAVAYLSAFAAMKLYMGRKDMLDNIIHLNILSLLIVTFFLFALVFFSWDVLSAAKAAGQTGYYAYDQLPTIVNMPMSRSSGMARFAAVPGILSFVFLWFGSDWKRFLWIIPLFSFGWIVYFMQSRGAVVAFAFVLAFEMLFLGGRKRIIGGFILSLLGILLMSDLIPGQTFEAISDYMKRGQETEDFYTMTGRTITWKIAWSEILNAPIIGRGFQADRYFLNGLHVHNTYLYALMTSGFIGATGFVIGLLWSWRLFVRAIKRKYEDDPRHKIFLIQAGGILAFFTVRGITEVSGPLFNVDFMVMLPIMAYLGILDSKYYQGEKLKIRW